MLQPDGSSGHSQLDNELRARPSLKSSASSHSFIERPHISGYMVQQRSSAKKLSRPSTAPSVTGDGSALLPSIPPSRSYSSRVSSSIPQAETDNFGNRPILNGTDTVHPMQTLLEDDVDVPTSSSFGAFVSLSGSYYLFLIQSVM